MKQTYITPVVVTADIEFEGILCVSLAGSASGRIDSVGEGSDYGNL